MIFPLAALSLTVVLDGAVVRSYTPVYLVRGRVLAPVDPFVTAVADGIGYEGPQMIVRRGDRFAQVRVSRPPWPSELPTTYVELAPILRTLGETVTYDSARRRLCIETPKGRVVATPTPFNAAVPRVAPTPVFTPTPQVTPRPVFTGSPVPRRTPIPVMVTPHPPQSQPSPELRDPSPSPRASPPRLHR